MSTVAIATAAVVATDALRDRSLALAAVKQRHAAEQGIADMLGAAGGSGGGPTAPDRGGALDLRV